MYVQLKWNKQKLLYVILSAKNNIKQLHQLITHKLPQMLHNSLLKGWKIRTEQSFDQSVNKAIIAVLSESLSIWILNVFGVTMMTDIIKNITHKNMKHVEAN